MVESLLMFRAGTQVFIPIETVPISSVLEGLIVFFSVIIFCYLHSSNSSGDMLPAAPPAIAFQDASTTNLIPAGWPLWYSLFRTTKVLERRKQLQL